MEKMRNFVANKTKIYADEMEPIRISTMRSKKEEC